MELETITHISGEDHNSICLKIHNFRSWPSPDHRPVEHEMEKQQTNIFVVFDAFMRSDKNKTVKHRTQQKRE